MKLLTATLLATLATTAAAEIKPRALPSDARIKTVEYRDDDVMTLYGCPSCATVISLQGAKMIFADGGNVRMENTEATADDEDGSLLGDWRVVFSGSRDLISIRPRYGASHGNLVVQVVRHGKHKLLAFELVPKRRKARESADATYVVKVEWPKKPLELMTASAARSLTAEYQANDPCANWKDPTTYNRKYTMTGADELQPVEVFDDGTYTYFKFSADQPSPLINIVEGDARETRVHVSEQCGYQVVMHRAYKFKLKYGKLVACVYNEQPRPKTVKMTRSSNWNMRKRDHHAG